MVTGDNNNKFYEMTWDGKSPNFNVKYGRVESTSQDVTYPSYKWDSKYNEKVKKGYKDVTDLVADSVVEVKKEKVVYEDIKDAKVAQFITLMKQYTDGLVSKTYSVKSDKVSIKQVNEAQGILDDISTLAKAKKRDKLAINTKLLELYMVIPRFMKDVRVAILPHIDLDSTLVQEQANLDAMSSQVDMNTKEVKKEVVKKQSVLDAIGVTMTQIDSSKEINHLVKQITGHKVKSIFEVNKEYENKRFKDWIDAQNNKKTSIVFHGTKNTSVIPILQQGLRIRPSSNFQFSGKAYGDGNYFSDHFSTSIGYTNNSNDNVLLVYEIHTGKESKTSFNNYTSCKKAGYDSFEGGWLRVAYNENQARIKYIIWLS